MDFPPLTAVILAKNCDQGSLTCTDQEQFPEKLLHKKSKAQTRFYSISSLLRNQENTDINIFANLCK
jgi:hypothetical protein